MEFNPGIILQSRLGSTRLPNKIILDFNKGKSILDIILEKITSEFKNLPIVISTGSDEKNLNLLKYSEKYGVSFFVGSEEDVLERFINSAESNNLSHIIRICSDNPFIDTFYIKKLITEMGKNGKDYISFKNHKGIPVIKTHIGMFGEIVSLDSLKKIKSRVDKNPKYCEHVTNYIYENESDFDIILIDLPDKILNRDDIRLTVDTIDDFLLASEIYEKTKGMEFDEFIDFLALNSNRYINKMVYNIKNNNK